MPPSCASSGLLAQFPDELEAAVLAAVYLHGRAGELGAAEIGDKSFTASIDAPPSAVLKSRLIGLRSLLQFPCGLAALISPSRTGTPHARFSRRSDVETCRRSTNSMVSESSKAL